LLSFIRIIVALPLSDERAYGPLVPILLPGGEVLCQITPSVVQCSGKPEGGHLSKDRAKDIFSGWGRLFSVPANGKKEADEEWD
jgi:hypothetical protein